MSFYTDLRDDVAGSLISSFGFSSATLRKLTRSYSPTTGAASTTSSDTTVSFLDVPKRFGQGRGGVQFTKVFSVEQLANFQKTGILSAKELAVASVTPELGDRLILGSETFKIEGLTPLAPAGTPVLFYLGLVEV